ncbi:unnamed protein product [Brassica oleracea]|uniref:(rape) hypothetical protein n=1 Tax=Brassica napus TaxID=3708 RepID=A0A816ID34_BRANA|nr:unnamed protein product [Brassica napus]
MKRAPPPEKRHQVNKKAERSSEAYPTPQTQSANTKTQTTAMLTWRKGRQQEGHTTEHTPTLKSSRHQHAPRRPRHTHGWDNPRALPPQTTTGRGENPLTKVSKSIFSSGVFIRRKRRRFWSQLLTVSNCRWLSLAVAVSSSPSRSFTATKLLRLALSSSSLGFRSGEEKASILSNDICFQSSPSLKMVLTRMQKVEAEHSLWLMIKEAEEKTMGELYTLCLVSGEQGEYIYCPRVHQWWKAFWQNCEFISAVHYCYSRRLYHKDLKVQQRFSNSWAQVHSVRFFILIIVFEKNYMPEQKLLKDGFIIRKPTKIHSPEEILKVKED